jgi:hypothetical protein
MVCAIRIYSDRLRIGGPFREDAQKTGTGCLEMRRQSFATAQPCWNGAPGASPDPPSPLRGRVFHSFGFNPSARIRSRKVFRFMPSSSAALSWLPWVRSMAAEMSGASSAASAA